MPNEPIPTSPPVEPTSPPPVLQPAATDAARTRLHQLATELRTENNRAVLVEYLQLRRSIAS
jgi:hypothetical protein